MFASSAEAERLFSRAGYTVSKLRASLSSDTVEWMLKCHDNIWLLQRGSAEETKAFLMKKLPYLQNATMRLSKRKHSGDPRFGAPKIPNNK